MISTWIQKNWTNPKVEKPRKEEETGRRNEEESGISQLISKQMQIRPNGEDLQPIILPQYSPPLNDRLFPPL
jgi:hypothetical protein